MCDDCGYPFEEGRIYSFDLDKVICQKCRTIFPENIVGRYVKDEIYPSGQKSHVLSVIPFQCPSCGVLYIRHEFYCVTKKISDEGLETIMEEVHPEHGKKFDLPDSYKEFFEKNNLQ